MRTTQRIATGPLVHDRRRQSTFFVERLLGLLAWAEERFPARNGVFFLTLYVAALVVGRGVSGAPITASWWDVAGFIAFWAFFLVLRVLDEHKDFDADAIAHPERVLQRGIVTLGQLRVVGFVAATTTLVISVWLDGGVPRQVTAWWLAVAFWSFLMAREFFARRWLRQRLVVYALSHMCVMPLVMAWALAMTGTAPASSSATLALMALAFVSGLAFEIARKVRAPADERPMADTYTGALGVRTAANALLIVTVAAIALGVGIARMTRGAMLPAVVGASALAAFATTYSLLHFRRQPSTTRAKVVEAAVGIGMLVTHIALIAAIAAARGMDIR